MSKGLLGGLCSGIVVVGGALAPGARAQSPYERAKARYDECLRRLPFDYHTEGRTKLARTGAPEALEVLIADYAKPAVHPEYARYTLATLLGRHFLRKPNIARLDQLRKSHEKPEHAWLWYHTLRTKVAREGPGDAIEYIENTKNKLILRATALLALGYEEDRNALDMFPVFTEKLPRNEGERRAVVSTLSTVLIDFEGARASDLFKGAARAYIRLLDKKNRLSRANQLMIARHLGHLFDTGAQWVNPEPWLELLDRGAQKKPRDKTTVAAQRFFGIESDGERICYIVDLSDSMCKKVDDRVKPKAAITGPRKKKKRKRGALPDETDIPWFRVKTRYDLAREHLKISLQRLDKTKRFSIIWIGTEADVLDSTNGMVKATRGNVARAIKELEGITPGPPKLPDAPDGTLRGRTNLHGALRCAFSLKNRGRVDTHDFVDPKAIAQGCDTIFVLTDGAPSWDDFNVIDKDYGEGRVVSDTEYGNEAPRTENIHYWGPYGDKSDWIVEDVRRMNAFRNVQIHCVGIGEANMRLLKEIAEATMGEVYQFGKVRGGKK